MHTRWNTQQYKYTIYSERNVPAGWHNMIPVTRTYLNLFRALGLFTFVLLFFVENANSGRN